MGPTDHAIHGSVQQLSQLLDNPSLASDSINADPAARAAVQKLRGITLSLLKNLDSTPYALLPVPGLEQLHNNLQMPISEVSQFLADAQPHHLINAAAYMDGNVLNYFWVFGARPIDVQAGSFIRSVQTQADEAFRSLNNAAEALRESLRKIKKDSGSTHDKLAQLDSSIDQLKSEVGAQMNKFESSFRAHESNRAETFEATLQKANETASQAHATVIEKADGALAEVMRIRQDAARLLDAIGGDGTTTNFKIIATSESDQANLWRWITVAIFLAGIVIAVSTFVHAWGQPLNSTNAAGIAIRLLYAIAITVPAWYTARESARHRTNADRAKQTELELATLGPFIELFEKTKKDEIKEKLIEKYFGKEVSQHQVDPPLTSKDVRALLSDLIKTLKR